MQKTRVAVLRGGPSAEADVSMMTGASVIESLDKERYQVLDVVITKDGEWLTDGHIRYPENILPVVDVVFIALHGTYGEDGSVQRLLDRHSVPYTGSGAYASGIAMNKVLAKDHLKDTGILLVPHMVVRNDPSHNLHNISISISAMFGPEYVVKPVASGSSCGVMMAENTEMLPMVLKKAFEEHDEVIVEQRIRGKEATCGVVNNFRDIKLYALPAIEIVPPESADFFDRNVKYDDTTEEICPGRFSKDEKAKIEDTAKLVHETLDLSQYSRSDFMVAPEGLYFLEVNTLPGLTKSSLFPKAVEAVGGTYDDLVEHLLTEAMARV